MGYYNTLGETGEVLKSSTQKAETQTDRILKFFEDNPVASYSPSLVHFNVGGKSPLTSTRRSMSDLTKEGKLEKTEYKSKGAYGKYECCLRLNRNPGEQIKLEL